MEILHNSLKCVLPQLQTECLTLTKKLLDELKQDLELSDYKTFLTKTEVLSVSVVVGYGSPVYESVYYAVTITLENPNEIVVVFAEDTNQLEESIKRNLKFRLTTVVEALTTELNKAKTLLKSYEHLS